MPSETNEYMGMPKFENRNVYSNIIRQNLDKASICLDHSEEKIADSVDVKSNEISHLNKKQTEIQEFYDGKNIFITGGSGFLGKILIEKLLRCCPGVETIYLLVRQKKGKDIYTRVDEIFDDPVFNRLKVECPKFCHKIVAIPGDCDAADLGLTLSDRQTLTENVNIIFHGAATVKFDEHLRIALQTNVCGTLRLLQLARNMKGLDVLMHVSTVYSNSHLRSIEEKFYPFAANFEELRVKLDQLTDSEIDSSVHTILGPWPNTYTFTKALAEKELKANAGCLPLGVFRPAIVTSAAREPLKCWIDNLNGPTGVTLGGATGILKTLHCDPAVTAGIVPVDLVVNCLLAAARNVHLMYKQSTVPPEPPIFHYVSSVENRLTWGEFKAHAFAYIDNNPFSNAVWYVALTLNKSALLNRIYMVFLHLIPALIVDTLAVCVGQKPKMLKTYRQIHKLSSVLSYFCVTELVHCNRRTRDLWAHTSDDDKTLFPFSMAELKWEEYFKEYTAGIRKYILKETDDTLPSAKIKWRRLYYLHQIVRTGFFVFAIYLIWSIMAAVFQMK